LVLPSTASSPTSLLWWEDPEFAGGWFDSDRVDGVRFKPVPVGRDCSCIRIGSVDLDTPSAIASLPCAQDAESPLSDGTEADDHEIWLGANLVERTGLDDPEVLWVRTEAEAAHRRKSTERMFDYPALATTGDPSALR
jgi:hypothetical protein